MKKIFIITAMAWGLVACDNNTSQQIRTDQKFIGPTESQTNFKKLPATESTKTVGATIDDAKIVADVNSGLIKDSELSALKINVDSKNGKVLLRGDAPNQSAKDRAEMISKTTTNVVSVDNQLVIGNPGNVSNNPTLNDAKDLAIEGKDKFVAGASNAYDATKEKAIELGHDAKKTMDDPNSSLNKTVNKIEARLDDAGINASINSKLTVDNELSAIKINVDVKNGKVWLKGTAPNAEAKKRASDLAKQVNGVTSVENQLVVTVK